MAEAYLYHGSVDDDVLRAYAWTMLDIAKREKQNGNTEKALRIANNLAGLEIEVYDDFAETLVASINKFKNSLDPYYEIIQQAKELSKNGENDRALEILSTLSCEGHLTSTFHEDYGWVIYRYLKEHISTLDSVQVRTKLRDYIMLENSRPSLLHSQILNFALNYSKIDAQFKFMSFLRMWGAENIRSEDFKDSVGSDGKTIPSLMYRVARVVVDYSKEDIKEFIELLPHGKDNFSQMLQEQSFWNLYHLSENGISENLWIAFDKYLDYFTDFPSSSWNSKVLSLAERCMSDSESHRFYSFFKRWNPDKLMEKDWIEEKGENGEVYKPLALKVLKRVRECIQTNLNIDPNDIQWLLDVYGKAIQKFPDDDWLLRSKALLYKKINLAEEAKSIYKQLVLSLSDKYYIWQEYAECLNENNLKIALLCKALSLEKNEDYLGKIRLELANCLIAAERKNEAAYELDIYNRHYAKRGWHIDPKAEVLLAQCAGIDVVDNNEALYAQNINVAENMAYEDIPYADLVFIDRWKNDKGKTKMSFVDGKNVRVVVDAEKFPILSNAHPGQIWKIRLHVEESEKIIQSKYPWQASKKEITLKYTPLMIDTANLNDWSILPFDYGYVEYVNKERKVYHIYSTDSAFIPTHYETQEFKDGDFVRFRKYSKIIKDEEKIFICEVVKCKASEAYSKFKSRVVAVDDMNISKQLFHYVAGPKLLDGIIHFDQTDLRPSVGDCIKIYYFMRQKEDKNDPDKKRKIREIIKAEASDEINQTLVKEIEGDLSLKYKDYSEDCERPDFAFIGDYYVHRSILERYNITTDKRVKAKAVYTGNGKWKVFEITEF